MIIDGIMNILIFFWGIFIMFMDVILGIFKLVNWGVNFYEVGIMVFVVFVDIKDFVLRFLSFFYIKVYFLRGRKLVYFIILFLEI